MPTKKKLNGYFLAWIVGGILAAAPVLTGAPAAAASEPLLTESAATSVQTKVKAAACPSLGVVYTSGAWYWWSVATYGAQVENCSKGTKRVQFILTGGARYGGCVSVAPGAKAHAQANTWFGGFRFC